jgi:hypothetical protein
VRTGAEKNICTEYHKRSFFMKEDKMREMINGYQIKLVVKT